MSICARCNSRERLSYHAYCAECKATAQQEYRDRQKMPSRSEPVLVIGGSSGIGAAIARHCRNQGHQVWTAQRRGTPDMHAVTLDLRSPPGDIKLRISAACRELQARWLVISGGAGAFTHPLLDLKQLDELTATNWTGVVAALQGFLSYWLRARKLLINVLSEGGTVPARVLYIGSVSEHNPAKGIEIYAATKAAASKYVVEFGRRYASKGIRANVLATGWVDSPMTADIDPERWASILRRIPAHRAGTPEEVAEMAYSILDGPDYLNGNRIEISGGL